MSYRSAVLLLLPLAIACTPAGEDQNSSMQATQVKASGPAQGSLEWKIATAESAAHADIAKAATILELPHDGAKEPTQLRAGTNGWTCMPDLPDSRDVIDPMCFDDVFLQWVDALQNKKPVKITRVGLSYMLKGDAGASVTDPYASGPTPDNQWVVSGPHVMMIVPNAKDLDGLPGAPSEYGAYVMWKGTPYAHIMMPVQ